MALLLHPDKNPRSEAAVAFKRVSDAFAVLSAPESRAEYDAASDVALIEEIANSSGKDGDHSAEGFTPATAQPEPADLARPPDLSHGPPNLKKRRGKASRPR